MVAIEVEFVEVRVEVVVVVGESAGGEEGAIEVIVVVAKN